MEQAKRRRPLVWLRTDTAIYERCKTIAEATGQPLSTVVTELLARALDTEPARRPPVTFDEALAQVRRADAA